MIGSLPDLGVRHEVRLQLDLVAALHYDPFSTWRREWVLSVFPN